MLALLRAGRALAAGLGAATLVAGCAAGHTASHAAGRSGPPAPPGNTLDQPVPARAATAPLVDQDGRPLTLRSLRGRVVVLAPVLTMCQETCPMTSENLHIAAEEARRAGQADRVVFLEVTVDPERDTVRRLHAYAAQYGALPDWRLATGRPAQVTALWKALGVSTEKAPSHGPVRDWLTGKRLAHPYDVHHQDVVVAIDPAGRLRWITVGRPDARGRRLPTTLHRFLDGEGRRNYSHPGAGGADSWTVQDVEQAVAYVRSLGRGG
jgi:protein SCO1/2